MLTIDLIITLFIIFWTLYGFLRGFITELTSLLCWSAAIYFSANYFYIPANHINEFVNSSEISNVLAFIGIFMFTFIFSSIIGRKNYPFCEQLGDIFFNINAADIDAVMLWANSPTTFQDWLSFFQTILVKTLTHFL